MDDLDRLLDEAELVCQEGDRRDTGEKSGEIGEELLEIPEIVSKKDNHGSSELTLHVSRLLEELDSLSPIPPRNITPPK